MDEDFWWYLIALTVLVPLLYIAFLGTALKKFTKECQFCGNRIPNSAVFCTHCRKDQVPTPK